MGKWGFLITIEGIEGSGKTTLALGLYEFLKEKKISVVFTREPGGTPGAEAIREVVLKKGLLLDPWAEFFLILAARRENVVKVIQPALRDGKVVVCDRYTDSTMAYQGYGRGLPKKILSRLNKFATNRINPNLTFLVDIPLEEGFERIRGREHDRFEKEEMDFHLRVREGYLKLARRARKRIHVLDGRRPPDELLNEAKEITLLRLKEKGIGKFLD
jgi:dTMP kinase